MVTIDKEFEVPNYSKVCHLCLNLTDGHNKTCKAFPGGIPKDIWVGWNPHTERHHGQNNDIVFKGRGSTL